MKKQNSAKGFKRFYFSISALWMVWFGYIFFAIAHSQQYKIIAFFAMLLPIPIYYILKGFILGSKEIMKQPKYILIIVVLGIIAFVGWNKIGTSVKDKELYVECFFPDSTGIIDISNGQMCFIDPSSYPINQMSELIFPYPKNSSMYFSKLLMIINFTLTPLLNEVIFLLAF